MAGFTIIELFVVIVVIGVLSAVLLNGISNYRGRSRDTERTSDIDTLRGRIEEYFSDHGGYPNTFTVSTFPSIDPQALKDPNGVSIVIASPATDQVAAASANPTTSANYLYTPYPTGCGAATCTGYVLKSYIEQPTPALPNPYTRYGINSN